MEPSLQTLYEEAKNAREMVMYIISEAKCDAYPVVLFGRRQVRYDFSPVAKKWGVSEKEVFERLAELQSIIENCQRQFAARTDIGYKPVEEGEGPPTSSGSSSSRRDDDDADLSIGAGVAAVGFGGSFGCF